jgi:parallel beta-helix repeat protein
LADSVLLDGAVLDDGSPDPPGALTVTWSVVSGPGVVTFSDASSVDTTATFSATGTYILRLTVDDSELSASDQLSITVNSAHAHTIRVPQDQPTIQAGIDAAQDGDLVLVSSGTYNEALTIANKTITLASLFYTTSDEQFVDQTIIDGNGLKVITVEATAGLQTKIIGFTIQNGIEGISAFAKLDILNNRFTGHGDAIDYGSGGGGLCRNNVFENNSDDAIDLDNDSEAIIEDNVIRNNDDDGIEIRLYEYSGPTLNIIIRNNIISGNGEDGIQLIDYPDVSDRVFLIEGNLIHSLTGGDNLIALNNLFVNTTNIALKGVDGDSIAAYNLFWNNGTDTQSSNMDMSTTLFADPLLDSNYQLQLGSPAIDASTAQYVLASGEIVLDLPPSAYFGAAPDLGAFESNYFTSIYIPLLKK